METIFWKRLKQICEERGTTPTAMCKEIGLSTGNPPAWKSGSLPSKPSLQRIAEHFGVEPEYFVGEQKCASEAKATEAQIKYALFGDESVSDELLQKVRTFAKFALDEERQKK